MKMPKKITGTLRAVLLAIALAVFATCITMPEDERAGIVDMFARAEDSDQERHIDWGSLPSEVIAWVEVPGTSIDEPIVQATPDEPDTFLYKDAMGLGAYGTPYIDCECSVDSRYVMAYGHHMSDGSAFADFASFIDPGYASEHQRINVYKRTGGVLHLQPIAVDIVNASRERLVIDQEADFGELVSGSDLLIAEPSDGHQLWAFTTCSYQTRNSRTIVYALQ